MAEKARVPEILVLATGNAGKLRELRELFSPVSIEVRGLDDFSGIQDVEETGSTFYENASIKARGFARQIGGLCLADDSGLEIEALGNSPGVYSARFAGEGTGYDVKIAGLLAMLDETGDRRRRARFACVMALANPEGRIICTAEGICSGTIATEPRGQNGFGYDPIFVADGFDRTFGELDEETKHQISHRGQASRLILRYLLDFIGV
jgi:XTP/dITP diphosphohydrolase